MGGAISKKEQAMNRFSENLTSFCCPICDDSLRTSGSGVVCNNNHSFDLARKGYLNLSSGTQTNHYDRKLFTARQKVFEAGFYDPLICEIVQIINELDLKKPFILDAGCGEGSLLVKLSKCFEAIFLGIDISRDAIRLATSSYESIMWCVADIANLPLESASVDVLFNILSPANYEEFRRVLKPDGIVVKVFPGEDYLRELRLLLAGAASYSNQDVMDNFAKHLTLKRSSRLYYQIPVLPGLFEALVLMTPLSRHYSIPDRSLKEITINLQIVVGTVGHEIS